MKWRFQGNLRVSCKICTLGNCTESSIMDLSQLQIHPKRLKVVIRNQPHHQNLLLRNWLHRKIGTHCSETSCRHWSLWSTKLNRCWIYYWDKFNIKFWQEFGKRCDFFSNLQHSRKFLLSNYSVNWWWSHSFYETKIPSVQVDSCIIMIEHPLCFRLRFGPCVNWSCFCPGNRINYMLHFFTFSTICVLMCSYQNP